MRVRAVNNQTWEWNFGKGKQDYLSNSQAIARNVQMKIKAWYGDCFFDMQNGIDWRNILGSKNAKKTLDDQISFLIGTTEGVAEVVSVETEVDRAKRTYNGRFAYKDIYGELTEGEF